MIPDKSNLDARVDSVEYSVELYLNGKFIKQVDIYDNLWAAEICVELHKGEKDREELYRIVRIDYDVDGNEIGRETIYSEEDE